MLPLVRWLMERLFVAPDLPSKIAAIKIGATLILRDQAYETRVRELLRDVPLQLIRMEQLSPSPAR